MDRPFKPKYSTVPQVLLQLVAVQMAKALLSSVIVLSFYLFVALFCNVFGSMEPPLSPKGREQMTHEQSMVCSRTSLFFL